MQVTIMGSNRDVLLENPQYNLPYVFPSALVRYLKEDSYRLLPEGLADSFLGAK